MSNADGMWGNYEDIEEQEQLEISVQKRNVMQFIQNDVEHSMLKLTKYHIVVI